MDNPQKRLEELERENRELREQLTEAQETLRAIQEGDVDALVVSTPEGQRVFTLQSADQTYRTIVEQMQEGAVTLIQEGRISYGNRRFAEMVRRPLEEIIGLSFREFVVQADREHFDHLIRQALSGSARGELTLQAADQTTVPVHLGMSLLVLDGQLSLCMVVADLTERKRAEELLASEQHYRLLFDRNPDGVFAVDATGRFILANPACEIISGYSVAELQQKTFADLCAPDRLASTFEHFERGLPERTYSELETALIRKDGRRVEVWIAGESVFSEGRVVAMHCTAKDITARKRAEEALATSRRQLQDIIDNTSAIVYALDLEERFVMANTALATLLNSTPEQMIGKRRHEFMPKKDADWHEANDRQAIRAGRVLEFEEHSQLKDRSITWLTTKLPLRDAQGRIYAVAGISSDISDRKRGEEQTRLLSEVTAELLASDQPQKIVESLCRKVMAHLDCHAFFNFLVDEEADRLRLNACAGIPEETAGQIEWLDYGVAVCGCVARDGCRIVAEHVQTTADPRADLVRSFGIQAYACHPLVNQGQVIGTLSFGSKTKPVFADDELALMKAVADHVAIAMQRIRLLESMEEHARAAQAANVAKSQFLASMSHELRTPMNAVLGMTDLALSQQLPATVRDYLQTAKESADLLLELLNEVLDFSRIEAERFELEATPFHLARTVEQVVKTLGVRAHEKGLELVCEMSKELPQSLVGDPLRLRQVLMNLVGNAIKFTHEGKIVVRVEDCKLQIEEAGSPPSPSSPQSSIFNLQFAISDTGIGIASENLDRIFSPFTQADSSTTRRFGGTGLGLAIAQRLVHLMGGRIWAESQPGRGSTFSFTVALPVAQPAESLSSEAGPSRAVPPVPVRKLRILLAEDTPANQKLVLHILGNRGHSIEIAENGSQALERIECQDFDVVLMDVQMPEMDGLTATTAIRQLNDPKKASLPIIAMTAHALKGDRDRCLAAGMNAYISKPIKGEELIEQVERLVEKGEGQTACGSARHAGSCEPASEVSSTSQLPVFDLDDGVKRCFGKYDLFRDMVGCLFCEADPLLEQMRMALAGGNVKEMANAAHRLKGTLGYLGAPQALDAIRRVEQMGKAGELATAARAIEQLEEQVELLKVAIAGHCP